jgi:hypothetical protein
MYRRKPTPSAALKIRSFGGLYEGLDPNDLATQPKCYTANGYNFRIEKGNLKVNGTATLFEEHDWTRLYGLYLFELAPANNNIRRFMIADIANSSGTRDLLVRYIPSYDGDTAYDTIWRSIKGTFPLNGEITDAKSYHKNTTQIIVFTTYYDKPIAWNGPVSTSDYGTIYTLSNVAMAGAAGGIELYRERLFCASGWESPNEVRWSDDQNPANWAGGIDAAGATFFAEYDGDTITAIIAYNDALYVHKKHAIGILSGDTPETFRFNVAYRGAGAVSPHAITEHNNVLYFISPTGLMSMNGLNVTPVAQEQLLDFWRGVDWESSHEGYYFLLHAFDNRLMATVTVPSFELGGRTCVSKTAMVNLVTGEVEVVMRNTSQYMTSQPLAAVAINGKFYFAQNDDTKPGRNIYIYNNGFATNDTERMMRYDIPESDYGSPEAIKSIVSVYANGDGGFLRITPVVDGNEDQDTTIQMPTSLATRMRARGRTIGHQLENTNNEDITVKDLAFIYEKDRD